MKYFPLVWAALRRKPIRTVATFLSVTVAFTLFGLMIGLSSAIDSLEQRAHADRIWTFGRFDMNGFPITVAHQIAKLRGIKRVTVMAYLNGYVGDPKNQSGILMGDPAYGSIFPDQGLAWEKLRNSQTAIVINRSAANHFHKKVGDTFTLIAPNTNRADGTKVWTFQVAAVSPDVPEVWGAMISGNYVYYDKSVPLADQGKIMEVDSVAVDPAQSAALAEQIDRLFASSSSPTQSSTEKSLYSAGNNFGGLDVNALTREIALAGLLMILFLTANVIAQSVRERLAEFATLKTIGYSDVTVTALVALEAALPCVAGAVCGIALSVGLAHLLPALMPPNYSLPAPELSVTVLIWSLASACILALTSTVLPAFRLRRMDIAAALSRQV